jgi:hypothetical protein
MRRESRGALRTGQGSNMRDRLTYSNVVATIAVVCGWALIGWAGVASASAAQQRLWNVTGSLTGTYTSDVTWVNCLETGVTGTAREQLRLNATLAGGKPALYQLGSGMVVVGKWRAGGSWSVTGSNPPRQEQANGDVTCGAQRAFHCGGPIRGGGGRSATIQFAPRGRALLGHFLNNDFFSEGDDPCPSIGPTLDGNGPLFGLAGTHIEPDAFLENSLKPGSLTIPRSRLLGRTAFSVRHSAGPDQGCPRLSEYSQCAESGRLTLTLRFKPAR